MSVKIEDSCISCGACESICDAVFSVEDKGMFFSEHYIVDKEGKAAIFDTVDYTVDSLENIVIDYGITYDDYIKYLNDRDPGRKKENILTSREWINIINNVPSYSSVIKCENMNTITQEFKWTLL